MECRARWDPRSAATKLRQQAAPDVLGGTLPYMAPEMFDEAGNIGVWTDIYAFGIMLYEIVRLVKLPFDLPAHMRPERSFQGLDPTLQQVLGRPRAA